MNFVKKIIKSIISIVLSPIIFIILLFDLFSKHNNNYPEKDEVIKYVKDNIDSLRDSIKVIENSKYDSYDEHDTDKLQMINFDYITNINVSFENNIVMYNISVKGSLRHPINNGFFYTEEDEKYFFNLSDYELIEKNGQEYKYVKKNKKNSKITIEKIMDNWYYFEESM